MLQRKNKKGFTLAELLIVVAIIAVLTAIAIPLFVSGIDNAKDATKDANIRAIRGEAVITILKDQKTYMDDTVGADGSVTPCKFKTLNPSGTSGPEYGTTAKSEYKYVWYVTAQIDAGGEISALKISDKVTNDTTKKYPTVTPGTTNSACNEVNGTYYVQIVLTEDQVTN